MSSLVSVIIPVYNVEKYLRKCLDSICNQTYRNLEILCVNDGSTDGSAAILEEYAAKDTRIKVFSQANAGLSAARNTALAHATGEWITGVDSDDYLASDAYEYALKAITKEVDIICFGTRVVWEACDSINALQSYFHLRFTGDQPVTPELVRYTNATFWSKLWRKSLIDHFQQTFPVGLRYEDNYFWYTLAPFARRIAFAPDEKIYYIQRSGSIMSDTTSPKLLDRLSIAQAILDFYHQHPLPNHFLPLDLLVFEECFFETQKTIPDTLRPSFHRTAQLVAEQSGLIRRYPERLRFLKRRPCYLKPFVKHSPRKSYYGLPGLPLLTITRRGDEQTIRFLCIKIHKKKI